MRGQRKFNASGSSSLSALDAGLGIGTGLVLPAVAEMALARWGGTSPTIVDYRRQLAGGIGIVLSIPLYFWRGLAPTMLGAVLATVYAVSPWVTSWMTELGAGNQPAAFGRLQASRSRRRARLGADLQRSGAPMMAAGARHEY